MELPNQTETTILFLMRDAEILLAMKKRGFGAGKWNGVGGKVEAGESAVEAAIRETEEETNARPINPRHVASLVFHYPGKDGGENYSVHSTVFIAHEWEGEPVETEEMAPRWFSTESVPYAEMWSDDHLWLPQVLAGEMIEAEFTFDDNDLVVKHTLRVIESR